MKEKTPILVVGSVVLDTMRSPCGESKRALGGSAIYFSGAASYFTEVRMVGVVGDDFPEEGYRFLEERKINTEGLTRAAGKTFHYEAEYGENLNDRKSIATDLNVFENFHPVLPEDYRGTPVVFLGNIAPSLQIEVLDQVENPFHVAADTMNFWIDGTRADLEKMLKRVDILFLNDSEAKDLTGERNLIAAIRAVRKFGPSTVVAKKGEHGAVLYMDGTFFTVPAYPLEVVPDPTGGGDSFAGGVLGYLAERGSFDLPTFRDAMLYGTAVASYVIEDFGPKRLYGLGREKIEERVEGLRKMMEL